MNLCLKHIKIQNKLTISTSEIGPMLLTIISTSTTAGGPRNVNTRITLNQEFIFKIMFERILVANKCFFGHGERYRKYSLAMVKKINF